MVAVFASQLPSRSTTLCNICLLNQASFTASAMAASHAAFAHHGVPGHIAGMVGWFASFCWYVFSCFLVELVTSRSTGSVLQQAFQSCVCMAVCWQPGKGKQPEDEVCQQRSAAASHAAFAHHGVPGYIAGGGYGKWRPADGSAGGAASDWSVCCRTVRLKYGGNSNGSCHVSC